MPLDLQQSLSYGRYITEGINYFNCFATDKVVWRGENEGVELFKVAVLISYVSHKRAWAM